jgi:hypothetical protein|tara:strand:- start:351 stop:494 length:144 start_codon:yes stop_codon:yes gene_type:complete
MARKFKMDKAVHEPIVKGTSIGRKPKSLSTMNKHKKRNFKLYRSQGR